MNIYVFKNLPTTRTLSKRVMLINTVTDKCWLHIENSSLYSLIETMDSPDDLLVYHSYFSLTTLHSMIKKHTHKHKITQVYKKRKAFYLSNKQQKNVRK